MTALRNRKKEGKKKKIYIYISKEKKTRGVI